MSIYEKFARKICQYAEVGPGLYDSIDLSWQVAQMPFGGLLWDKKPEELGRLGQEVGLQAHMQQTFFSLLESNQPLHTLVRPFLVSNALLRSWATWEDWIVLEQYLKSQHLIPYIVFHNMDVQVNFDAGDGVKVADVRVMCVRDQPYSYMG